MTVKNFTMNMSGVVAQGNNQVNSFGVWFDSQSEATLVGSQDAFNSIFGSKSAVITQLLAQLLPAHVSFAYPTSSAVVTSFTMVISGVVAFEDNTVESFSFEVAGNDVVTKHISTGGDTYEKLISDPTAKTLVATMWEGLVGTTVELDESDSSDSSNSSGSSKSVSSSSSSSRSVSSSSSSSESTPSSDTP
jgi:hypothetical protein